MKHVMTMVVLALFLSLSVNAQQAKSNDVGQTTKSYEMTLISTDVSQENSVEYTMSVQNMDGRVADALNDIKSFKPAFASELKYSKFEVNETTKTLKIGVELGLMTGEEWNDFIESELRWRLSDSPSY
ncbi:MAG: hypothetical protein IH946_03940 [Bacteroidetes bacterium]|nr:hypothetical protein [Bacteroidota bacterium]